MYSVQVYHYLLSTLYICRQKHFKDVILFKMADSKNKLLVLFTTMWCSFTGDDSTLAKQQRKTNLTTGSSKYDNITVRREYLSRDEMLSSYCICSNHCLNVYRNDKECFQMKEFRLQYAI